MSTTESLENPSQGADNQSLIPLYRHSKRPSWGLGMIAWERSDRRGYQFEDGSLRIIKKGYYGLFEMSREASADTRQKLAMLCRRAGFSLSQSGAAPPAFGDQLSFFRSRYPDGFADKAWLKKMRGQGVKRRIKRHRDAAVAEAREHFSREVLDRCIAEQRFSDVVEHMIALYEGTDLVTKKQLKPLYELTVLEHQPVVLAVRDLLYGEGAVAERLDAYIRALTTRRYRPSWQLATALPALALPREFVFVRPNAFSEQAKVLDASVRMSRRPNGRTYERLIEMARNVGDNLEKLGNPAADLLDVYDFMWATLKPSARQQMVRAPGAPTVATAKSDAAADGDDELALAA